MTKELFITRSKSYIIRRLLFVPLVFVIIGIGWTVLRFLPPSTPFQKSAFQGCFFAAIVGLLAVHGWYDRRQIRRLGLRCPACRNALTQMNARIAIAADHCPFCGGKLFTDDRDA